MCDCWYLLLVVRFRSLPPSPSSLRSSSPFPAHHVLKCVSPPDAALPNHPSSVSYRARSHRRLSPPRGQEPVHASSYLYLERGFINRSKLPFRAYYPPFVKPVSRSDPPSSLFVVVSPQSLPGSLGCCCCDAPASGSPLLTRDAHPTSHSSPRFLEAQRTPFSYNPNSQS